MIDSAMDRLQSKPAIAIALGSLLVWAAFPPLKLFWLAPFGVAFWLLVVQRPTPLSRSEYFRIGLVSFLMWLGLLQGIRLAYWLLYAGWVLLSLYVAIYLPLFIAIARTSFHRFHVPWLVAIPVTWVGLELFRGYFATGFATCLLAHTQIDLPIVLQIASQLGSYGVSAWVVLAGCAVLSIAQCLRPQDRRFAMRNGAIAIGLCFASLLYGWWELGREPDQEKKPLLKVALVQENSATIFEADAERNERSWNAYLNGTERAGKEHRDLDMVVWPESVFSRNEPVILLETELIPKDPLLANLSREQLESTVEGLKRTFRFKSESVLAAAKGLPSQPQSVWSSDSKRPFLLVGSDLWRIHDESVGHYNAALWIGPDGKLVEHYSKQHLVMFGEYFPFGDYLPFLYQTFPMPRMKSGAKSVPIEYQEVLLAPSICFENTLPHLLRRQIRDVTRQKRYPDLLINISNDGWFRGSSILDHHLASGILAAVENRRPMLIAANTGLSAWIDGSGRKRAVSQRLKSETIIAEPIEDQRTGLWRWIGDWPARLCTFYCFAICCLASIGRFRFDPKKTTSTKS